MKSNPSLIKEPILSDLFFRVNLPWLQRRNNKLNNTLFDTYYSQNCKVVTFRKITNRAKYK